VDATREERARFSNEGVQLDDTLEVLRRYRVRGMPTSIFIDANGVVQGVWVGLITPAKVAELLAEVGITWQP
jgi:thioredoxin-related protein